MGGKRTLETSEEKIRRKIRKLEEKLQKTRREKIIEVPEEDNSCLDDYDMQECTSRASTPYSQSAVGTSPPQPLSPLVEVERPQQSPQLSPLQDSPPQLTQPTVPSVIIEPRPVQDEPVPSASNYIEESTTNIELNEDILLLLGDAPKNETTLGKPIHKDVARRWQEILAKGLPKDVKTKIIEEYLIPSNCELLVAPLLNPEAKAALPEHRVKRDFSLMLKQKQIGIAISALAQATELIIANETSVQKLLKPISDACRLLCDSHYNDTKTRRNFVTADINYNLKEALTDSVRDKYLFGENISEKLKVAKTIQQSGDTLKPKKHNNYLNKNSFSSRNVTNNNNHLNSKVQHRKTVNRPAGQHRSTSMSAPPTGQRQPRGARSPRRGSAANAAPQTRNSYRK